MDATAFCAKYDVQDQDERHRSAARPKHVPRPCHSLGLWRAAFLAQPKHTDEGR